VGSGLERLKFWSPDSPPKDFMHFKTREPQFSEGGRLLHVFGKVFGRISSRSDSYREHPIYRNLDPGSVAACVASEGLQRVNVLQDWTRAALSLQSYPTGEDITTAYFATVSQGFIKLGDDLKDLSGTAPNKTADVAFYAWCKVLLNDGQMFPHRTPVSDISVPGYSATDSQNPAYQTLSDLYASQVLGVANTWDMHNWMLGLAENGALFTTDNGYMGVAFHAIRKGDLVVLLSHAGVPMVIRPDGAARYHLVAPAYVHPLSGLGAAVQAVEGLEEFVLV
jgi:hypothetical protein